MENGSLMHKMLEINTSPGYYNKIQLTKSPSDPKTLNIPFRIATMKKVMEENQVFQAILS